MIKNSKIPEFPREINKFYGANLTCSKRCKQQVMTDCKQLLIDKLPMMAHVKISEGQMVEFLKAYWLGEEWLDEFTNHK